MHFRKIVLSVFCSFLSIWFSKMNGFDLKDFLNSFDPENNTNVLSFKGKLNRDPFLLLNIAILIFLVALFSYTIWYDLNYMSWSRRFNGDITLLLLFSTLLCSFSVIKRCRAVGVSTLWALASLVPFGLMKFFFFVKEEYDLRLIEECTLVSSIPLCFIGLIVTLAVMRRKRDSDPIVYD